MNTIINTYSLLNQTSETLEKIRLKLLSPYRLNCNEYGIIDILCQKGEQSIYQIEEEIMVSSSSMTYVMDKLEGKNYIKRKASFKNCRSILLHVTKEGKELWDRVSPKDQTKMEKVINCLTKKETKNSCFIKQPKKICKHINFFRESYL